MSATSSTSGAAVGANAMISRVVTVSPELRDAWERLYAGYEEFYRVTQTSEMRATVWGRGTPNKRWRGSLPSTRTIDRSALHTFEPSRVRWLQRRVAFWMICSWRPMHEAPVLRRC